MEGLTGILVCGGKSTRMGTDKRFLKVDNQPLIYRTLQVLDKRCTEVLISCNDAKLDFLTYNIIPDQFANMGPMGGIYTCLKSSSNNLNFVVACDMPMVSGNLLEKMLKIVDKQQAVIPLLNNRPQPLYGLYNKSITPAIKHSIDKNNFSLQSLLKQMDTYYVEADQNDALELMNINTYSEYIAYEQMARNHNG